MKKLIIGLILTVMLLIGCAPVPLHNTQVLDKQYEPARTWVMLMPISTGKSIIMIPYIMYDDEDWVLNVMGYTKDGERKCRRIYVTPDVYDKINIGDKVDYLTMQYKDEHKKERK